MPCISKGQNTSWAGWIRLNGFLAVVTSFLCVLFPRKKAKLYDPLPPLAIIDGTSQGSTYNGLDSLSKDTANVRITTRAKPDPTYGGEETEATPLLATILDSARPKPTLNLELADAAGHQKLVSAIRDSQGIIHLQPKENVPTKTLRLILRIIVSQEREGTADVELGQRIKYSDEITGPHDIAGDSRGTGHVVESIIAGEFDENEDAESLIKVEPPENQSMHAPTYDLHTNACHRIKWDKKSYLHCKTPPAVKITDHEVLPAQIAIHPGKPQDHGHLPCVEPRPRRSPASRNQLMSLPVVPGYCEKSMELSLRLLLDRRGLHTGRVWLAKRGHRQYQQSLW